VPIVLKSGSLKLLKASGPVQACNGIALLFRMIIELRSNSFVTDIGVLFSLSVIGLLGSHVRSDRASGAKCGMNSGQKLQGASPF